MSISTKFSPTQALHLEPKKANDRHVVAQHIVEGEVEEGIVVASDSSADSDFSFHDTEDEDDDLFQDNVDVSVEDNLGFSGIINDDAVAAISGDELELEEDSKNLKSLSDSDGERKVRYPEFNPIADMKKEISLRAGMIFGSNDVFRDALQQHSIHHGGDFYYLHNDKSKVSAYCRYKCDCRMIHARKKCVCKKIYCGFKACARLMGKDGTFQLKTWVPEHTCGWQHENSRVTSKWLSERYLERYRDDPKWRLEGFMGTVKEDYKIEITYIQAWRARMRAYLMTQGDCSGQYARVWDYAATLIKKNPGSSIYVKVCDDVVERPLFQRLYICLDACKKGFIVGCRPIIGLDGCHLKGPYTGQVLTAVAKDGNENIFPIAFAVVEAERKETWCWFLEILMQDLGQMSLTFMSDRQKGLLEALSLIAPMADTRVCVRHLYNNFRMKWSGKAFKDALWAAARATNVVDFEDIMAYIKRLDEGAYAYLMKADPNTWARHRFKFYSKSDMLLNNVCESFNNYILRVRDKPLLTMCDWIRRSLMKRFVTKRTGMSGYVGPITPKAKKRVEKAKIEALRSCRAHWGGGDRFEVEQSGRRYVVDLDQRSCGCNKWNLTGIPCPHAASCIMLRRLKLEDFVDKYYSTETYLKAYCYNIEPLPEEKKWVKTGQTPPAPPMLIVQPGRPKKARRKEQGEEKTKKNIRICDKYNCSHCGRAGHNKKKCTNPPKEPDLPKSHNKGGRPINPKTSKIAGNSKKRLHKQGHQTLRSQVVHEGAPAHEPFAPRTDRASFFTTMGSATVGHVIPKGVDTSYQYAGNMVHQPPLQLSWGISQASGESSQASIVYNSDGIGQLLKNNCKAKAPWKP